MNNKKKMCVMFGLTVGCGVAGMVSICLDNSVLGLIFLILMIICGLFGERKASEWGILESTEYEDEW